MIGRHSTDRLLSIAAVGDMCLGDHYFTLGHGSGTRLAQGHDPFVHITGVLAPADLCIGNLEGPLSSTSIHTRGPKRHAFRGPEGASRLLRRTGFTHLHVANNHILQHGAVAFERCISAIRNAGIEPVGLRGQDFACSPAFHEAGDTTVALLGYSFVPETYIPNQTYYSAPPLSHVLSDIARVKSDADCVVVSIHWGRECVPYPPADVRVAAHRMVDEGATLVLGHHPHWFQPLEGRRSSLIAYSLGDLMFDLFWDPRSVKSAILHVTLGRRGVKHHALTPVRFEDDYCIYIESPPECIEELPEIDAAAQERQPRSYWDFQQRKLSFFLAHIFHGAFLHKLSFLLTKLRTYMNALIRRFS